MPKKILFLYFVFWSALGLLSSPPVKVKPHRNFIHHYLQVQIIPDRHYIQVKDEIYIPPDIPQDKIHFLLHGDLSIKSHSPNIKIIKESEEVKADFFGINSVALDIKENTPLNYYSIQPLNKDVSLLKFVLTYEGKIYHPLKPVNTEYARGFAETAGIISPEGLYLAGSSFWIPWFNDDLFFSRVEVILPETWDSVCIGERIFSRILKGQKKTVWNSLHPTQELYLVGGKFSEYELYCNKTKVMAFLLESDEALANKYLETTCQYLKMYQSLIGPYPYSKFALVENFWETGYGMPSFTLLGPKIIRFPFILHSSYPHELLHNWWGNSVFVNYQTGNWCEGITVYLADHLIKEQRGKGVEYRRTALQNYSDYITPKNDFPLIDFKARYDPASSAIGYGKSMMFFHMLRNKIGDQLFLKALKHFYKKNRFKQASFEDIRKSFEYISGKNLEMFFQQWIYFSGSPELKLSEVKVRHLKNQYQLNFRLEQVQGKKLFEMDIPIAVYLAGQEHPTIQNIKLSRKMQDFKFSFSAQPLILNIDPLFDIFRRLDPREVPPALSKAFGSDRIMAIIPGSSGKDLISGYKNLAQKWFKRSNIIFSMVTDKDVKKIHSDKTVWIFGWENDFKSDFFYLVKQFGITPDKNSLVINNEKLFRNNKSFVFTARNPHNPSQVIVFLATTTIKAFDGLFRKLPHYGKYSYLVFEGDEPTNIKKGQWPIIDSPLYLKLTDRRISRPSPVSSIPSGKPLAKLPPVFSEKRMLTHIKYLSSAELKGRGLYGPGIRKAGEYIADQFKISGLIPGGDNGTYFQKWINKKSALPPGSIGKKMELSNVIGLLPGQKKEFENQAVVLCAHYDHLGFKPSSAEGQAEKIYPGADDNASGVSILLELAHYLAKNYKPDRSIIFIAFSGEESNLLGSNHYLETIKESNPKKIIASINLDTVGRLNNDKLLVIGGSSAREWKFIFMGISYTTGIETELISQELDSSDQVSFIKRGIPAVQLFTGPHFDYHKPTDTPERIDPAGLVKVTEVAKEAIVYLSQRKESLTVQNSKTDKKPTIPARGKRRVKTGIMPDFSFSGSGVKIGQVSDNSPASKSGLQKGDIIIKVGDLSVQNLKEYARALSSLNPGNRIMVTYLRNGKEYKTRIVLIAR